MIKKSNVVVFIPTYNAEESIGITIDSCLNQTVTTDIWVVDNCSVDKTRNIVKKYQKNHKNIFLHKNHKNVGRTENWNVCLDLFEKSKFKYIKFLFAGDEIFPACIEEVDKAFSIDNKIAAVAFRYEFKKMNGDSSISPEKYDKDKLLSIKEISYVNLSKGGLLGAIVCNAYSKKAIKKYRFNNLFIGKADFDYEIFHQNKALYLNKVLARFNLKFHRTFFKSLNFISETEYAFNRAHHLEKNRSLFTKKEYQVIKNKILIEFVTRSLRYFKFGIITSLFLSIIKSLPKTIGLKLSLIKKNPKERNG